MEITYDPRYNIAYIRLRRKAAGVKTVQVSEEMNIDLSPDGKVYGIELLNARVRTPPYKEDGESIDRRDDIHSLLFFKF